MGCELPWKVTGSFLQIRPQGVHRSCGPYGRFGGFNLHCSISTVGTFFVLVLTLRQPPGCRVAPQLEAAVLFEYENNADLLPPAAWVFGFYSALYLPRSRRRQRIAACDRRWHCCHPAPQWTQVQHLGWRRSTQRSFDHVGCAHPERSCRLTAEPIRHSCANRATRRPQMRSSLPPTSRYRA